MTEGLLWWAHLGQLIFPGNNMPGRRFCGKRHPWALLSKSFSPTHICLAELWTSCPQKNLKPEVFKTGSGTGSAKKVKVVSKLVSRSKNGIETGIGMQNWYWYRYRNQCFTLKWYRNRYLDQKVVSKPVSEWNFWFLYVYGGNFVVCVHHLQKQALIQTPP